MDSQNVSAHGSLSRAGRREPKLVAIYEFSASQRIILSLDSIVFRTK